MPENDLLTVKFVHDGTECTVQVDQIDVVLSKGGSISLAAFADGGTTNGLVLSSTPPNIGGKFRPLIVRPMAANMVAVCQDE